LASASKRSPDRAFPLTNGGLLFRLTPNIQVDLRAGFGLLYGRPDDFFLGTGFPFCF